MTKAAATLHLILIFPYVQNELKTGPGSGLFFLEKSGCGGLTNNIRYCKILNNSNS